MNQSDLVRQYLNPPKNLRSGECKCDLCEGSRIIREVMKRGDVEEMRQLISELSECLCNSGEELSMSQAYVEELKSKQIVEAV